MRCTIAVVVVCLLIVSFGRQHFCSDVRSPDSFLQGTTEGECLCDDEGRIASVNVVNVEDLALRRQLSQQGIGLMEQKATVDTRILIKQLDFDRCELNLPQPASITQDPVDLFRSAKDSIVVVSSLYKCDKCTRWHASTASGFVISDSGAVVTNYHVVNSPTKEAFVVMTADRHIYPVTKVLAASRADDLAILKIEAEGLVPLPIAKEPFAAPVGSPVSVISHPAGQYYCYTSGVISRHMKLRAEDQLIDAVSITADFARGSSGAPVLNNLGQVVGVVRNTQSVYYSQTQEQKKNLQMVFKTCVPSQSLLKLIDANG